MTPTVFQIIVAIVMVAVAIFLVSRFLKYKAAGSEKRLRAMLEKAGLDPEIASSGDTEVIMKEVRRRCHRCQTEDVCERWLAGEVKGGNEFCPNARIFEVLAKSTGSSR
jgi:hypothetical protein